MRSISTIFAAVALTALSACNQSATEQKADAVEQNAEDQADAIEEASDNGLTTEGQESALENQADAVRDAGANAADEIREGNAQ